MKLFLVIYYLFSLKAVWRCLYFWQLKEYRLDRFKDLLATSAGNQYFWPSRWFLRPKLTLKAIGLTVVSLWLTTMTINSYPYGDFSAYLVAYLLIPFLVFVSVWLFYPLTFVVSQLIVAAAKVKLARYLPGLKVIGITGSYGKTATKTILTYLLEAQYEVLSTSGSVNTPPGVAMMILRSLQPRHQVMVVEMGAYKKGEIKTISDLVKPEIGVLTGITKQHLELFGSFDNLKEAKFELLAALPKSGLAVVNGANDDSRKLGEKLKKTKVIFYIYPKKDYDTNLLGQWQNLNIAAAVVVARHLKIKEETIISRLQNIPDYKTNLKAKTGLNRALVINSTLNANPEGFAALIDYADNLAKFPKKVLVTSGIIELGEEKEAVHRQLGVQANKVFDAIYVTKPELADLFGGKAVYQEATPELIKKLKPQVDQKTTVVLIGRLPQKIVSTICSNQS